MFRIFIMLLSNIVTHGWLAFNYLEYYIKCTVAWWKVINQMKNFTFSIAWWICQPLVVAKAMSIATVTVLAVRENVLKIIPLLLLEILYKDLGCILWSFSLLLVLNSVLLQDLWLMTLQMLDWAPHLSHKHHARYMLCSP